jgi:hypothetical protein
MWPILAICFKLSKRPRASHVDSLFSSKPPSEDGSTDTASHLAPIAAEAYLYNDAKPGTKQSNAKKLIKIFRRAYYLKNSPQMRALTA